MFLPWKSDWGRRRSRGDFLNNFDVSFFIFLVATSSESLKGRKFEQCEKKFALEVGLGQEELHGISNLFRKNCVK